MAQHLRRKTVPAAVLIAALAGAACPTASWACQGARQDAVATPPGAAGPFDDLRTLADLHRREPDARVKNLPPPAGVDRAAVTELSGPDLAPGAPALATLEDVLASTPAVEQAEHSDVDSDTQWESVRRYVAGRSKLVEGDAAAAIVDLLAATRLDPNSGASWRVLGEAQLKADRRASGMVALREAVRHGERSARLLWMVGREFARTGREQEGLPYLAQARRALGAGDDAGLTYLINADLGEALLARGRVAAGSEALRAALEIPDQFTRPTSMRDELAEIYRRRSDLWRTLGDASCKMGRYDAALEAYDKAAAMPSLDPGGVRAHRTYALLKLGRSGEVALGVVQDIDRADGHADARQIELVRLLSPSVPLGPALAQIAARVEGKATPGVAAALTRARAAASPPGEARALVSATLAARPPTDELVLEFLRAVGREPASAQVGAVAELTAAHPEYAPKYARVLLAGGLDVPTIAKELRAAKTPGAHATLAALLDLFGGPRRALAEIDAITDKTDATHAAAAEYAARAGDWARARAEAAAIADTSPVEKSEALRALQEFPAALAAVEPLAGNDGSPTEDVGRIEVLLRTADLALLADRPDRAESLLQRARAADPYDDRAYDGLIGLYGPGGAKQDQSKLAAVFRQAREANSSSRALRRTAAMELIGRGLLAQAEPVLMALAEEQPENPGPVEMLASLCDRQQKAGGNVEQLAQRLGAWLAAQRAARPGLPWLITAGARVAAIGGHAAEADKQLEAELARTSELAGFSSPEIARARERIIGEFLGDPARARAMELERLRAAAPGIDQGLELADALLAQAMGDEAADVLTTRLPADVKLTREQSLRLLLAANKGVEAFGRADKSVRSGPRGAGMVRVLDLLEARGLPFPLAMHETRLGLIAASESIPAARLASAVTTLRGTFGRSGDQATGRVVQEMLRADDNAGVVRFYRALTLEGPRADPEPAWNWLVATLQLGTHEDRVAVVDTMPFPEPLRTVIDRLPDDEQPGGTTEVWLRAQLAYGLGNFLSLLNRDQEAAAMLRLALERQPDHAWAANNLGYQLLENDGDLNEAQDLILRAIAKLGGNPHVVDSLGWLRYKQGVITDEKNPDGTIAREGAVTLLQRAVEAADDPSEEGLDHLADARWRAGDREGATKAWRDAETAAMKSLARMRPMRDDPLMARVEDQMQAALKAIRAKIEAVQKGQEPRVAK